MTTYAVADLHGRHDLLMTAFDLATTHSQGEPSTFVVTGDFVDRGPQSRQIIVELMKGEYHNLRLVVLKGNHEDMMAVCVRGHAAMSWWIGNGGGATLHSYGYASGDTLYPLRGKLDDHLIWIDSLPIWHEDKHRFFVHAGVDPGKSLAEQSEQNMLWMRSDRHSDYRFNGKHVVHGHEQFADGPILLEGRSDLDTLAWYTGRLAVGVFDDAKPGGPAEILWATGEPA